MPRALIRAFSKLSIRTIRMITLFKCYHQLFDGQRVVRNKFPNACNLLGPPSLLLVTTFMIVVELERKDVWKTFLSQFIVLSRYNDDSPVESASAQKRKYSSVCPLSTRKIKAAQHWASCSQFQKRETEKMVRYASATNRKTTQIDIFQGQT